MKQTSEAQIREMLLVYLRIKSLPDLRQGSLSDIQRDGELFCGFDISSIPYFCIGLNHENNFHIKYTQIQGYTPTQGENDFPSLSDQHCSIVQEETVRWLHDLGTASGTYLGRVGIANSDFVKLDRGYENKRRLSNGDIIGLLPYHNDFLLRVHYACGNLQ